MFVRWRKRKRTTGAGGPRVVYYAYLVESYRDEEGKPRQRHIGYLGHYAERGSERSSAVVFWGNCLANLAKLELSEDERAAAEKSVAKRIPRPTSDEVATEVKRFAGWITALARFGGGDPRKIKAPRWVRAYGIDKIV